MRTRFSLGLTLSVALAALGCLDEASVNNDNSSSATAGTNTGGNGSGVNATTNGTNTGGTNANGTNTGGTNANGTNTGGTNANGTNANGTTGGDGGVTTGGDDGGASTGAWMPPATSQVAGTATANSCLSTATPQGGNCGSYYCGVTQEMLTPEINPSAPCGGNPEYACKAELTAIVTACGQENSTDLIGGSTDTTTACVKDNPDVAAAGVTDACISCFVNAALCCAQDLFGCGVPCLDPNQAGCDAAQRQAGCVDPVFACSGLPNPF